MIFMFLFLLGNPVAYCLGLYLITRYFRFEKCVYLNELEDKVLCLAGLPWLYFHIVACYAKDIHSYISAAVATMCYLFLVYYIYKIREQRNNGFNGYYKSSIEPNDPDFWD